jgi:spermidine/putrescine-binding protein
MKHWLSVTVLSFLFCFLFGAWWGHRLQKNEIEAPRIKTTLKIAAEKGYLPPSFLEALFKKYHLRLVVETYESPAELQALLKENPSPDLIQFPSYLFKSLQHRDLLGPLDVTQIPNARNISKDLRFGAWDPKEDFALPLSWNALFFVYHPDKIRSATDSFDALLKAKKLKLSMKKNMEDLVWISQALGLTEVDRDADRAAWMTRLHALPWEQDGDLEKFTEGKIDLLQMEWSEIQSKRADLGEFKLWPSSDKTPFYLDFIAVAKNSANYSKAYEAIHQLLDKDIYPGLISAHGPSAVMDLESRELASRSAKYFRQLPMTEIQPLINSTFDLKTLDEAQHELFK